MTTGYGIYVHVPFCARRCDYCAFATWTDRHHLTTAYLAALVAEIERATREGLPVVSSVFVGGGTPSMVPAAELMAVLDAIPRASDAEVTDYLANGRGPVSQWPVWLQVAVRPGSPPIRRAKSSARST